jgi:PAS domain S-box-containing protein
MSATDNPREPGVPILLVDDYPANLVALEAVLDDPGHDLVKARSGEEALRLLTAQDFAVVLLDVRMHGMDGFEAAKVLRARERSRHTPIIFLTAHDDNRLPVEAAYALGAVDYLVKPVVPVILRAKVAVFTELFRKSRQLQRQAEQLRQIERSQFERKLAEENARLRESEQRFARFMQHLPGLAWVKDLQGRYVFANDAALKAFSRTHAELHGKTDDEIFSAECAACFRANDARALGSATGVRVVETLPHPDGVLHYSVVSKFPIPGPDGAAALIGGMAIDITDRIEIENTLKEADRRKDEFLAMLAHELRNPLAPIRNALYVLRLPQTTGPAAEGLGNGGPADTEPRPTGG